MRPSTGACGHAGEECATCTSQTTDACGPTGCMCSLEGVPCAARQACVAGRCEDCVTECCPSCDGKCAGAPDGCGGACGQNRCDGCCTFGAVCLAARDQSDAACGAGGAACGACLPPATCGGAGAASICGCAPNCAGRCGGVPDGCGGTCQEPCITYAWAVGDWSACSVDCGSGARTRKVQCRRSDGVIVEDARCSGAKPPSTETCGRTCCPPWPGGHVLCLERSEFDAQAPCMSTEAYAFYYTYYIVGGASVSTYRSNNRTGTCADYCASHPAADGCR